MHQPTVPFPHYMIPTVREITEARHQLGEQLRQGFASASMTDPAQIGMIVADAQEYPPRDGIPFHAAVVESWFRGEALPSEETLETIQEILADKTSKHWNEQMDALLDIASFNPRHMLNTYSKDLASALHTCRLHFAQAVSGHSDSALKSSNVCSFLIGHANLLDKTALYGSMKRVLHETYGLPDQKAEGVSQDFVSLADLQKTVSNPTELSTCWAAYSDQSGMTGQKLGALFSPPLSPSTLVYYRNGQQVPSLEAITQMDDIMRRHSVTLAPPLKRLCQLHQRLKGEQEWREAARDANFGQMLKSVRLAMGLSQEEMANALQSHGTKISNVTLCVWEANKVLPNRKLFPGSDIITTYSTILHEYAQSQDPLVVLNYGPFWTPERETALRSAYHLAMPEHTRSLVSEGARLAR